MGRHRGFDPDVALDAATRLFWQKGFEATTLDDLEQATHATRPTLYHWFGNKEDLFRKVLRRYELQRLGVVWRALRQERIRDVLDAYMTGFIQTMTDPETPDGCLGINAALVCSERADATRSLMVDRRRVYEAALRRRLALAQRQGELDAGADPALLAGYFTALMAGMAIQAKGGRDEAALLATARLALAALPLTGRPPQRA